MFYMLMYDFLNWFLCRNQSPVTACIQSAAFAISNLIRDLPDIAE